MGAAGEIIRGGSAAAAWFLGLPFVNLRVALTARDRDTARGLIGAHCARFLARCRITVEVGGTPPVPGTGCVVCYNEASFADVAAFCAVMWPHIDRAAAADLYAWFPFGRTAARKSGIEMVPRGNRAGTDRLMERAVAALRGGERVAWGGEGRIHGRDEVGRFKIGASLIAIRAQVPVVPVAFQGGHGVLPLGSVRARPGTIRVRFGAPIPTAGLAEAEARDLTDRVQAAVAGLYADLGTGAAAP